MIFSVFVLHSPVTLSMTCTVAVTVYGVDKLSALFKKYVCYYSIDLHMLRQNCLKAYICDVISLHMGLANVFQLTGVFLCMADRAS